MSDPSIDDYDGLDVSAPATQRAECYGTRTLARPSLPELWVVQSPDAEAVGQRLRISNCQPVIVGRDSRLETNIADSFMSKEHFAIVVKQGRLEFTDLGSTNGTFVNGVACTTATITEGAVIRAGDSLFVLGRGRWLDVEERARRIATTAIPALLQGATGTGKEVIARLIHAASGRRGAFVAVNCAALTRDLILAEFFGHTRGAFSGAVSARDGLFRAAEGGTLFLDEIGELPLEMQPVLLRALETHRVRPLGADIEIPFDVRIIAASNAPLEAAAESGRFRADLLARLARAVVHLPPLCERREDVLELARTFSNRAEITPNAAEALLLWEWRMNVRQLRSVMHVAAALATEPNRIHLGDLAIQDERITARFAQCRERATSSVVADPAPNTLAKRRRELRQLLEAHRGNISHVAQALGKPRAQIYRWVRSLGLDAADYRKPHE